MLAPFGHLGIAGVKARRALGTNYHNFRERQNRGGCLCAVKQSRRALSLFFDARMAAKKQIARDCWSCRTYFRSSLCWGIGQGRGIDLSSGGHYGRLRWADQDLGDGRDFARVTMCWPEENCYTMTMIDDSSLDSRGYWARKSAATDDSFRLDLESSILSSSWLPAWSFRKSSWAAIMKNIRGVSMKVWKTYERHPTCWKLWMYSWKPKCWKKFEPVVEIVNTSPFLYKIAKLYIDF